MHKTNEAWGQFTSNSIQAINENRHLFIEEDLLSAFKWVNEPNLYSYLSFEIKYPICVLAELKVHWAQPWNKHDYANVTWLNKISSVKFFFFYNLGYKGDFKIFVR